MIMMGFHGSLTISIPSSDILVLTKAASRRIGNRLLNGRSFCDSATTTIYLIAHSIQVVLRNNKKSTISGITSEDWIKGSKITVDFRLLSLPMPSQTHFFIALFFTICEHYTHSHCELDSSKKCEHKRGITFSQTVRK